MKYGRFYGTLTFRLYCYDKIVHRLSSISPGIRWRSALGRGMHTRHARLKTVFYLRRLRYYISVGKKTAVSGRDFFKERATGIGYEKVVKNHYTIFIVDIMAFQSTRFARVTFLSVVAIFMKPKLDDGLRSDIVD